MKILIIEDEKLLADSLKTLLTSKGFQVEAVYDGETGADYALDIYPRYGSDVEATLTAGFDLRHGLIGPGVYASHGYERSHIDGVYNSLLVLCGYLGV